jgi:hypothetical protein
MQASEARIEISIMNQFGVSLSQAKALRINAGYGFKWDKYDDDLVFCDEGKYESQITHFHQLVNEVANALSVSHLPDGRIGFIVTK